MTALGWILPGVCSAVSGLVGWLIRAAVAERAEFRAEELRDAEWDKRHGIGDGRG